jgi:hypothetical protein
MKQKAWGKRGGEKVNKRKSWVRKEEDIEKAEKKDENRESIGGREGERK